MNDFEKLTLSYEDICILKNLRHLSLKTGYEWAVIIVDGQPGEPYTSRFKNRVHVSIVDKWQKINIFHSHTNNTAFSSEDFRQLLNLNVERIVVVTRDGEAYVARRGDGMMPDRDEFDSVVSDIEIEVDLEVADSPDFCDLSYDQKVERAVKEKTFRIARNFKWIIEGGTL